MRLSKLVLFFVLAFSMTSHAQDDVMVDLSVLDGLGSTLTSPSKPLFPILPKKTKAVSKPKIVKKKTTAKVAKPVVKPIEVEEKIVVVDVEPIDNSKVAFDEKTNDIEQVENQSEETVQVVDVEPVAEVAIPSSKEPTKIEEVIGNKEPSQTETASLEDAKPELLISDTAISVKQDAVNNVIVFKEGVYELSQDQTSKVDEIIKGFKDPNANKIAIYSYNLDDGVDTFKKKRTSLNRAVEIRSHLIKQGYKNFSIKVVNIDTNSDKINTVELEEI